MIDNSITDLKWNTLFNTLDSCWNGPCNVPVNISQWNILSGQVTSPPFLHFLLEVREFNGINHTSDRVRCLLTLSLPETNFPDFIPDWRASGL